MDFCDGLPLFDEHTGERISTELFVGALGASSYTFAWATLSQDLPTWLDCHVRMYEFFSGVSAITVPDNLRSAIKTPDRYEAEINPAYRELAEHYGTCIIAARVKKPRDKGKVGVDSTKRGTPMCPKCETPMVTRTAKKGSNVGGSFWGCAQYPKCRHTVPMG